MKRLLSIAYLLGNIQRSPTESSCNALLSNKLELVLWYSLTGYLAARYQKYLGNTKDEQHDWLIASSCEVQIYAGRVITYTTIAIMKRIKFRELKL